MSSRIQDRATSAEAVRRSRSSASSPSARTSAWALSRPAAAPRPPPPAASPATGSSRPTSAGSMRPSSDPRTSCWSSPRVERHQGQILAVPQLLVDETTSRPRCSKGPAAHNHHHAVHRQPARTSSAVPEPGLRLAVTPPDLRGRIPQVATTRSPSRTSSATRLRACPRDGRAPSAPTQSPSPRRLTIVVGGLTESNQDIVIKVPRSATSRSSARLQDQRKELPARPSTSSLPPRSLPRPHRPCRPALLPQGRSRPPGGTDSGLSPKAEAMESPTRARTCQGPVAHPAAPEGHAGGGRPRPCRPSPMEPERRRARRLRAHPLLSPKRRHGPPAQPAPAERRPAGVSAALPANP